MQHHLDGFTPVDDGRQERFQAYFTKHLRFTAGVETQYGTSPITHSPDHQQLAPGMTIGKRFHSDVVVRMADAKVVQLGHTIDADGRWRIFAFADAADATDPSGALARLCAFLRDAPDSPVRRCTPPGADIDAGIDRATGCTIVVRPDQHVAHVLPLDDHEGLATFCAGFMLPAT